MRYVRHIAATILISAPICATVLWATDNSPALSDADKKKIKAYCQKIFDNTVDDCLKNPGRYANAQGGANCTQVGGEMWAQCMNEHGLDTSTMRPPRPKDRPLGRPQVGLGSPTPSKRKVIDGGAVTSVKTTASATPTPTPYRTPRPVLKTGPSASSKKG